jgi:hypothetical protein
MATEQYYAHNKIFVHNPAFFMNKKPSQFK